MLPDGAADVTFGVGGSRSLDYPFGMWFTYPRLTAAEPNGGITVVTESIFASGGWGMLRVTPDGTLDKTFGGVGYISGSNSGNQTDIPLFLARGPSGYVVSGYSRGINNARPFALRASMPPATRRPASESTAVYRAYNNRFAQNDSNHRYATELALLTVLQSQGWTLEGAVFCGAP